MPPKPYTPPSVPDGVINKTDHDSRMTRTQGQPTVQGYNAQAAVTRGQIIVAAMFPFVAGASQAGMGQSLYAFMCQVLASDAGHKLYKHRKATVEQVFAQNKFNRGFRRFQRRGRAAACWSAGSRQRPTTCSNSTATGRALRSPDRLQGRRRGARDARADTRAGRWNQGFGSDRRR
jgi:DDE family transposase